MEYGMTYAHIAEGTVDRVGLPRTGTLADGSHISASTHVTVGPAWTDVGVAA